MFQIQIPKNEPYQFKPEDVKVSQREKLLAMRSAEEIPSDGDGTQPSAPAADESVSLKDCPGAEYDFDGVSAAAPAAGRAYDFGEKLVDAKVLAQPPYAAIGKLRWSQWNDNKTKVEQGAGTAWINRANIVFTAAHNLWDKRHKEYFWDFVFLPQFRNDYQAGPGYVFEGAVAAVPESFKKATGNHTRFDLGFLVLTKRAQETAGRLGWIANIPVNSTYQATGYCSKIYPAGTALPTGFTHPYDGSSLWRHGSKLHSIPDNPAAPDYEPGTMRFHNLFSKGASGGPWCLHFPGKGWAANGMNGRKYGFNLTVSPYFGPGFVDMVTASQKYMIGS